MELKKTLTRDGERAILITRSISLENLPEKYQPHVRQYTGIPSVEFTGDRLWCMWQTGGDKEPHPENYCVIAYSDDRGDTFCESALIIEAYFEDARTNVFIPMLITDEEGRLIILFSLKGKYYATVVKNPTAPIEEIEWEEPRCVLEGIDIVCKPLKVDKDGRKVWYFFGDRPKSEHTFVIEAAGEDKLSDWQIVGKIRTKNYCNARNLYHEAMAIETAPGEFCILKRLEKGHRGGIERAYSRDYGRTWTDYEDSLPYPLTGPGSKFTFLKLMSGNVLLINHDSTEERRVLVAHLSLDGGNTFPYSLTLDERGTVSYPETCEGPDGGIYVSYDKGRIAELEIRIARIREEDIIAGKLVCPDSRLKIEVSRAGKYEDVCELLDFDFEKCVKESNSTTELLALLPEEIKVRTNRQNLFTTHGTWTVSETKRAKIATYKTKELPYNVNDTFGRFIFEIKEN